MVKSLPRNHQRPMVPCEHRQKSNTRCTYSILIPPLSSIKINNSPPQTRKLLEQYSHIPSSQVLEHVHRIVSSAPKPFITNNLPLTPTSATKPGPSVPTPALASASGSTPCYPNPPPMLPSSKNCKAAAPSSTSAASSGRISGVW